MKEELSLKYIWLSRYDLILISIINIGDERERIDFKKRVIWKQDLHSRSRWDFLRG
jgi:hypothetical protein